MKHGIVGRIKEGNFRYQGWPSVCRDENGVLYAVCSGHRLGHICPYGKNVMYISRNDGETWSCPIIVNDTALDDRDAGIVPMGNGRLLLSWFDLPRSYFLNQESMWVRGKSYRWESMLTKAMLDQFRVLPEEEAQSGSFVKLSEDGGFTWSEAIRVPVTAPHGPAFLKNGKLIYVGKTMGENYVNATGVLAVESADGGKTWEVIGELIYPENVKVDWCHEPHVAELPDGTLLAATRVHDNGTDKGESFTVYLSRSKDGGKTWSVAEPTGWCGSPPHVFVHSSGAIVVTYARRMDNSGTKGRVSLDGGKTWSEEVEVGPIGLEGDLGYPCTAELSDGSMITVYYQRLPEDRVCSILYTKWKLSDAKFN